jgi:signal transduction histidine kinase
MYISSIISFFISTFLSNNSIQREMKLNQQAIGVSILELRQKTDLAIEDIVKMESNFIYDVHIIEDIDAIPISNEEIKRLKDHEIVHLSDKKLHKVTTVLMLDDYFIGISLHAHNNIFRIVASRVGITLISYIVIGSFLIALSAKRAVRPIMKLTSATQEVARGNFDVQVDSKDKDEIGQLIHNFNRMTKELKSIEYLRKDFISSVSHEFKTPIASIQGFAKLLQNNNLTEEEKREYTQIIIEETARLSRLSSNILNLSRIENQEMLGEKTKFLLDEQIRKTILLLEHEWSVKNIEFDIELDKVQYLGDEELLQQVWINLLNNAIKFSHENGKITVRLYQIGSVVKIKISDTGIGMDEDVQKRIFEKFYQGDKSHFNDGNGLGLAIIKRIVDLCGGRIYVKSCQEKGSTFTVELPL